MEISPNLALPYIAGSQAQKHVTHNEALRALDAIVQLTVADRDLAAPPVAADGDRYIVAPSATGEWAGHSGEIAAAQDGGWSFHAPKTGWMAYVADEARLLVWDGAAWSDTLAEAALGSVAKLGVNATADLVNRLAVKSGAVLFDHAGAGMQLKLNKAGAAQTLSLLFQNGYSGRAEMGLAGDDHLRIKVSADGATWREAFRADAASGEGILGALRVSREMIANVLPDSGRFNGNASNTVFSGISYAAPSYLSAVSGAVIAALAKFIHDNTDHGGSAGTLDPEVRLLVEKIRPAGSARRNGPEWYVVLSTNTSGALIEPRTHAGTQYGLPFTNAVAAMPARYSFGYYVKVKTGSVLIAVDRVLRASIDGTAVPSGSGSQPVVLTSADGWKHVNLETVPNVSGYDYRMAQLLTPAGGELWFAMPKLAFGHLEFDPAIGVLMNTRMFG